MTFDEYWNDLERARAGVGLYTHQIARAAYEAGARGARAKLRGKPRSEKSTKPPCLCGHDDTDHDVDGECYEVCACAGYTLNPEDSNLSHTRPMQRLRAELAEAKAALQNERDRAGSCCDDANRYREELSGLKTAITRWLAWLDSPGDGTETPTGERQDYYEERLVKGLRDAVAGRYTEESV